MLYCNANTVEIRYKGKGFTCMLSSRRLKWVPNAITSIRILCAVPIFICALQGAWVLGFWLLLFALATDFLDGLAAKKLDAKTAFGEELDGLADAGLVVAGMTGLSASGHLSWWVTAFVLATGAIIGSDRVFRSQRQHRPALRMATAVSCLFMAWVGTVWFFASLAFGWQWWYVLLTAAILLISALFKRHRLRAWLGLSEAPSAQRSKG